MDTTDPDLTFHQSLEALAGNATSAPNPDTASQDEPISTTMRRWQALFPLDPDTAISAIQSHRQNLTRARISDEHWATIRAEKEGQGYDREAYEYELEVMRRKATIADPVPAVSDDDDGGGVAEGKEGKVAFLVELDGVLVNEEKVAEVAGLSGELEVVSGRSVEEGRAVRLCCIDGGAKAALLRWAADRGGGWEPTILADPRSLR